jgi:hypothetical protein
LEGGIDVDETPRQAAAKKARARAETEKRAAADSAESQARTNREAVIRSQFSALSRGSL